MSPSNSNKKNSGGPIKRYTTRQIMELTEKRRKQMDEEARLELEALARQKAAELKAFQDAKLEQKIVEQQQIVQSAQEAAPSAAQRNNDDQSIVQSSTSQQSLLDVPVNSIKEVSGSAAGPVSQDEDIKAFHEAVAQFTRQVIEHPARFEFPPETEAEKKEQKASTPIIEKAKGAEPTQAPTVVDGKSVAAMFREQPQTPTEQAVSELIEREFDKAAKNAVSKETASPKAAVQEVLSAKNIKPDVVGQGSQGRVKEFMSTAMAWMFMLAASVLLVFMFAHVVYSGWSRHYYDQSSFVVLMALSALWLNRRNLQKRTQWFWGSAVIIAGGLGVFLAAALEGRIYLELAGFVIVTFGLFLWRYTEESASRLFFPLVCLMFMLAPPGNWEQSAMPMLNDMIYGWSAGILNSFHLPALFDEGNFHVGAGTVSALGDPAALRSIVSFMSLAAVCVSLVNMSGFWSLVLCLSVAFWGVLANILRVTITGMMLENFGVEYASMFFAEYSVVVVMIVLAAGITLTAGLLPHKEE